MRIQLLARFSTKLVGLAFVLWLGVASQAAATTITATYTGTVKTGFDQTGLFGTPATSLVGANYTLVFSSDANPATYSTFNGTITDPAVSGDQIFGATSAVLTINGHNQFFGATPSSYDIAAHKPGFAQVFRQAGGPLASVFVSLVMNNPDAGFPTSVLQDASIASCVTCSTFMIFGISSGFLSGSLNFGTLTVTSTPLATTPIPAALPLLVSALGGLGFVGWRRKKARG